MSLTTALICAITQRFLSVLNHSFNIVTINVFSYTSVTMVVFIITCMCMFITYLILLITVSCVIIATAVCPQELGFPLQQAIALPPSALPMTAAHVSPHHKICSAITSACLSGALGYVDYHPELSPDLRHSVSELVQCSSICWPQGGAWQRHLVGHQCLRQQNVYDRMTTLQSIEGYTLFLSCLYTVHSSSVVSTLYTLPQLFLEWVYSLYSHYYMWL